ncbi:MAG: ribosome biogenesis GTP-binding protein YihA/YsxC [Patescibacteria group bacterium]
MPITSAKFIQGIVGTTEILDDAVPQVAFIGRSNAGKSTIINSLTHNKKLARVSRTPGRTQEINLFLINKKIYFLDLPGYGYAKVSKKDQVWLQKLINWHLFKGPYIQKKVVLIIDAYLGPTDLDLEMLARLDEHDKDVVVIANKIDKIRQPDFAQQMANLRAQLPGHLIIPYSSKTKTGVNDLLKEILAEPVA